MALTERTRNVLVEIVVETGHIQIKRVREILDGETVIASQIQRKVLEPGDDASELNGLLGIKDIVWTPAVLNAHAEKKAKQAQDRPAPPPPIEEPPIEEPVLP